MPKRFFQLYSGPLEGRTLTPASPDCLVTAAGDGSARLKLAIRAHGTRSLDQPGEDAEAVHIYEAFDRADEISLEIILCKYVGTLARLAPTQN